LWRCGQGRTVEQKKKLVKGKVEAYDSIGVPAEALHVIINDVPKHNWASGGKLVSDEA